MYAGISYADDAVATREGKKEEEKVRGRLNETLGFYRCSGDAIPRGKHYTARESMIPIDSWLILAPIYLVVHQDKL